MDLQLIGYWLFELSTYSWVIDPGAWLVIFKVAFGLGMVIFVHELGHFGVAKLCGVQCDKFYLGFDIGGWKFCKFKWGETEYGIGILPLGGYVKMLGQEDNPARLKEELERAKAAKTAGATAGSSSSERPESQQSTAEPTGSDTQDPLIDIEAAEQALYNPRSYLAQSVPKRMAIISAGVIMNLIFAFICAVIAFYMGVRQSASVIGQVQPGSPAWMADMETDDRVLSICGKRSYNFNDIRAGVTLGNNEDGVEIVIQRPGETGEKTVIVRPTFVNGLFPTIGVLPPQSTTFTDDFKKLRSPTLPGSAADLAQPAFEAGDKIIKIDDEKIETYFDIHRCLIQKAEQPIKVTVERPIQPNGKETDGQASDKESQSAESELVTIEVDARPMRRFGLVMSMGPVLAVKSGSPAEIAGIRPGDVITKVDGQVVGDPMTLSARLRKRLSETIPVQLERNGKLQTVDVVLEEVDTDIEPIHPDGAVGVPELGIAYNVLSTVTDVKQGSSAEREGIKPGDVIVEAVAVLPDDEILNNLKFKEVFSISVLEKPAEFSAEEPNWPFYLCYNVQILPPQSRLKVKLADGRDFTLEMHESKDWFNTDRGFALEPLTIIRRAEGFSDAVSLGWTETLESTMKVFVFIQKLSGGDISIKALGGPFTIARAAGSAASEGTAELMLFLTLLSANLAVINFLPIPVLDGGHMVFLAWEGIRGKPADERIQLILSYLGLIFILGLMIFVLGLDFNLISRN